MKGEESLTDWAPRGASLIRDFIQSRRKRQLTADADRARRALKLDTTSFDDVRVTDTPAEAWDERQRRLVERAVDAFRPRKDAISSILQSTNTDAPADAPPMAENSEPSMYIASAHFIPKNPSVIRSGQVWLPDPSQTRWEHRYLELRPPYLHIHALPSGDEVGVLNLIGSRIDHEPEVTKLLSRESDRHHRGRLNVFAVYATTKAWLFATRTHIEKLEWILAIDSSYFSSGGSGTPENGEYE